MLSCLERAELLIRQHQKAKKAAENRARPHPPGTNPGLDHDAGASGASEKATTPHPSKCHQNGTPEQIAHVNHRPSPTTTKKETVHRVIQDYPDDLRALFVADNDEDYFDSPQQTVRRRLSLMQGLNSPNNSNGDCLNSAVEDWEPAEIAPPTAAAELADELQEPVSGEHRQMKLSGDQALTDIWSATLRESQSVTLQLRSMLTELQTSEEEKIQLQVCLARLEEDAVEKQQLLEAQLKRTEKEKQEMAEKLQEMAQRVAEVERQGEREIQHVRFHSSNAEQLRRAELLALEQQQQQHHHHHQQQQPSQFKHTVTEQGVKTDIKNLPTSDAPAVLQKASNASTTGSNKPKVFAFHGQDFGGDGIIFHLGCVAAKQVASLDASSVSASAPDLVKASHVTCKSEHTDESESAWVNPGQAGLMSVTRSSEGGGEAYHALSHFRGVFPCRTFDAIDSWFCIDMGATRRVSKPTHYSLRMGPGMHRVLVEWVLEASVDGRCWTTLDDRRRVWKMPMPFPARNLGVHRRQTSHGNTHAQHYGASASTSRRHTVSTHYQEEGAMGHPSRAWRLKNQWHWPDHVRTEEAAREVYATGTWAIQKPKKSREQLRAEAMAQLAAKDHKKQTGLTPPASGDPAYRYFRLRNPLVLDGSVGIGSGSGVDILGKARGRSSSSGVGEGATLNLCGFEIFGELHDQNGDLDAASSEATLL